MKYVKPYKKSKKRERLEMIAGIPAFLMFAVLVEWLIEDILWESVIRYIFFMGRDFIKIVLKFDIGRPTETIDIPGLINLANWMDIHPFVLIVGFWMLFLMALGFAGRYD